MANINPPATNTSSKFTPFSLTLANGTTTTGVCHIPPPSPISTHSVPLLVGVHGGTCTAHNYDVHPSYSASLASSALNVPFVAFNRPSYHDSSPLEIPEDSSFHRATGTWEHEFILPAIWEKFGKPYGCTGIVLTCHSMGVPGGIVAASLWAQDTRPAYPLAGLIFSGWGTGIKQHEGMDMEPPAANAVTTDSLKPYKKLMMLSEDEYDCYDPEVLPLISPQNVPIPVAEVVDGRTMWFNYGPGYAKDINVPIMYGIGEHDWLWEGGKEYVKEFEKWFPKCPRYDGSSILGAPHALEWSRVSQGWYARCFGWAMEVCAAGKRS